ncbi:MAG: (Fe-S)-binding protein [Gammaproteobacteria bacterium]|nr:(Fe-S)-binding protein [Gammaproteobacteria bacterium]MDH5801285.1 (Fe-S)-binding protein [Gammaproteobacteria bacterium]
MSLGIDHGVCHGCSLCVSVCPSWQDSRDIRMTPKYCIRLMQAGAVVAESFTHPAFAVAARHCILCGACHAACPRQIDLYQMMVDLRNAVLENGQGVVSSKRVFEEEPVAQLLIPGPALAAHADLLRLVTDLLNSQRQTRCASDLGEDIIQSLILGLPVSEARVAEFSTSLQHARTLVVDNGLLYGFLKRVLPERDIISLAVALGRLDKPATIGAGDFYVLNARIYHADYRILRPYYDNLRNHYGCRMNLDLQRVAQPTRAGFANTELAAADRIDYLLQGYDIKRIIVEELEDMAEFKTAQSVPVHHLAEVFA